MSGEGFIACCPEGGPHAQTLLSLLRGGAREEQIAEAIALWAVHCVDVHGAVAGSVPACAGCWEMVKAPPKGFSLERWREEGRVHRVVHTLGIEKLMAQLKEEECGDGAS